MIFQSLIMFSPFFSTLKGKNYIPRQKWKIWAIILKPATWWTGLPSFMEIVPEVKKLNSIPRGQLNFRRRPILCTTLYRNPTPASNFGGTCHQLFFWIFYCKRRNFRREFNFVAFVYLKKYEINFDTNFSSTWFAGLSIVSSCFHSLWSFREYEIKFHTKGYERKSTKFFAYAKFLLLQYAVFTQDAANFSNQWCKKVKNDQKLKSRVLLWGVLPQ